MSYDSYDDAETQTPWWKVEAFFLSLKISPKVIEGRVAARVQLATPFARSPYRLVLQWKSS